MPYIVALSPEPQPGENRMIIKPVSTITQLSGGAQFFPDKNAPQSG